MPEPTSIQVSTDLWQALNRRKRPGDTFEDVIWRELGDDQPESDPQPRVRDNEPSDEPSDPLDELEFPGGRDRDDCIAAIDAAARYLKDEEKALQREIVAKVMPDHSLGYDVDEALERIDDGERFRGAWWRRVVKPGLEALDEPEKPSGGQRQWRWTEP